MIPHERLVNITANENNYQYLAISLNARCAPTVTGQDIDNYSGKLL